MISEAREEPPGEFTRNTIAFIFSSLRAFLIAAEILSACRPALPKYPEITDLISGIYQIEVLKPIPPGETGLPEIMLPKIKEIQPIKLFANLKSGKQSYIPMYVFKDPFGKINCFRP